MSNAVYDLARFQMHTAQFDWRVLSLVLCAMRGTPSFVAGDITLDAVIAHGAALSGASLDMTGLNVLATGVCQSDPAVIPAVPIGPDITHFVLVRKGSPIGNSQPVLFIDEAIELPVVPNTLDIVVQPDWALDRGWFL